MKLISLITKNFKRLGNFECTFTDGLNVIAGDNARGKSTLLLAIEAAWFGCTVVPGKKDDIPTWGQKDFGIELTWLSTDGSVYQVTRNKTTAKLQRLGGEDGPQLVANGNTPVTTHVEQLLGLTAKDYSLFIQSKQHEAAGVLTFGATALNRKVEEFAGVDVIDKVQSLAQTKAARLSAQAEASLVAEEDMNRANEVLALAKSVSAEKAVECEERRKMLEEFTTVALELDDEGVGSAELSRRKLAYVRAEADLEKARTSVTNAQANLVASQQRLSKLSLQDADDLKERQAAKLSEGGAISGKVKQMEEKVSQYDAAKAASDKARDELAAASTDYEDSEVGAAEDRVTELRASLQTFRDEATELRTNRKALLDLAEGATCPTCGHKKEEHDPDKLTAEAEALYTQLVAKEKQRDDYSTRLAAAEKTLTAARQRAQNVASLTKRSEDAGAALAAVYVAGTPSEQELGDAIALRDTLRNEYAAIKAKLEVLQRDNDAYNDEAAHLAKLESELEQCQDHVTDAAKILEDLGACPTDVEIDNLAIIEAANREAKNAHSQKKARLQSEHSLSAQQEENAATLLKQAEDRVQELLARAAKAKELTAESKQHERLVRFLRDRRQQYMVDVWSTITAVSSKLVRMASKDTITSVANVDGAFQFEEDGVIIPAVLASGAQKGLIGTSLRIGLARALYGSDSLMIFDEPTESCSEHNAASMSATLASSAKQTLLITHRENDQALADHIINVGE